MYLDLILGDLECQGQRSRSLGCKRNFREVCIISQVVLHLVRHVTNRSKITRLKVNDHWVKVK